MSFRLPVANEETTRRLYVQIVETRVRLEVLQRTLLAKGLLAQADLDELYSSFARQIGDSVAHGEEILGILEAIIRPRDPASG